MSKPLLPGCVPPLADRLRALLRTLPPGKRVTATTLAGWLSVSADPADVTAALQSLRAAHQASAEVEYRRGSRPIVWWGP